VVERKEVMLKNAGGLWKKMGTKGPYLAGNFEPDGREGPKIGIMVFPNADKEPGSNKPDFRISVKVDDEDGAGKGARAAVVADPFALADDPECPF
jgi:hypothetical protein